jgi:hypothetical protein
MSSPVSKNNKLLAEIIGEAILLSSIQVSLGSVIMSSVFSIYSFAKDQVTLQKASDALSNYLVIACIWTFGTALTLFAKYGKQGLVYGILFNALIISWIYFTYRRAFRMVCQSHGLTMPTMFESI